MIGTISTIIFAAICGSVAFEEEIDVAKRAIGTAAKRTGEQMAAAAYTDEGRLVKGYRTQESARLNRTKLPIGTVIYLPDGTHFTAKEGLHDVQSQGWWYAWKSL